MRSARNGEKYLSAQLSRHRLLNLSGVTQATQTRVLGGVANSGAGVPRTKKDTPTQQSLHYISPPLSAGHDRDTFGCGVGIVGSINKVPINIFHRYDNSQYTRYIVALNAREGSTRDSHLAICAWGPI